MSYTQAQMAHLQQIAFAEETTYKTRPTNIDQWIRCLDMELPWPTKPTIETVHAHGEGRAPSYVFDTGKKTLEGSFSYEPEDGQFIGAILGICVSGAGPPYTHAIDVANSLPSFAIQTAFLKSGDKVIQEFLGCKVNSATLKYSETAERLIIDVDYYAATAQDGGASEETITPGTSDPYIFKLGVLTMTSLYGGAVARVHDFECKINNNCKHNHVSGGDYWPYDIVEGRTNFEEMNITVGIESDTEWDEVIGAPGTSHDFSLLFTRGASDTFQISGNAKLKEAPPINKEHDIRAKLVLIPSSLTITVVDSIETYPFE